MFFLERLPISAVFGTAGVATAIRGKTKRASWERRIVDVTMLGSVWM